MSLHTLSLGNMVTTAGGTASNAIPLTDDGWAVSIFSTAASFTSTSVTVEVEWTSTGTNFVTLQSGGSNVLMNPATAMVISPTPFFQIRMAHSGAEAAERTFHVRKMVIT